MAIALDLLTVLLSSATYPFFLSQVTLQFKRMLSDQEKLEACYIMGHRLVSFLEFALPEHPEYLQSAYKSRRLKCHQFLQYIHEQIDQVALEIDEIELNAYMDLNFDPAQNGSVSSAEDDPWHDFAGWDAPACVDTDTSSRETSSDEEYRFDLPAERDEFPDPDIQFYGIPLDDDETSHDSDGDISLQPISTFLRKVANEDVVYETDSDADDSWAQSDNDESLEFSSDVGISG